jgi:NodT family efflux transporter outer membrane factor (OMF) lipoprotein
MNARDSLLRRLRNGTSAIALVGALAGLAGCVSVPYKHPSVATPSAFKEDSPSAYRGAPAGTWRPAQPQAAALKGRWWQIFGDPELNGLEEQLNAGNQSIAAAFGSFMAARAQVSEARASYFPSLSAGAAYSRSGQGTNVSGIGTTATATTTGRGTYSEFQLPFDASWEPDLWGRIRQTVRAYRYAAQVSAADLESMRLSEQASLAAYYFQLRGQDSLQALYDRTVAADRESLDLTRTLYHSGIDDDEAVAQAEVTLENAQATAAGIADDRALYEHAIATLIGKPASSFSLPVRRLTTPVPPIPVGVPSAVLERRPDIAAAERTMAEANAQIGIARSAYFPTLDLTASAGVASTAVSSLFDAPALFWSVGTALSETLFDGGLRRATVAQYAATYRADEASYRETVLTAFQQVEDELATLRILSQELARQHAAVAAAQRYLGIATARYQTGIDPYLNVMTAEQTLLSDQQTELTLRVNLMTAAVGLVQALGGGWHVKQPPMAAAITSPGALRDVTRGGAM